MELGLEGTDAPEVESDGYTGVAEKCAVQVDRRQQEHGHCEEREGVPANVHAPTHEGSEDPFEASSSVEKAREDDREPRLAHETPLKVPAPDQAPRNKKSRARLNDENTPEEDQDLVLADEAENAVQVHKR